MAMLCMLCFIALYGFSRPSVPANEPLLQQAASYLNNLQHQNWQEVSEKSHPGYIHYYGGKLRFLRMMKHTNAIRPMENSPELIAFAKSSGIHQAVLSYRSLQGEKLFLVASSADNGKNWLYFPLPAYQKNVLFDIMPDAMSVVSTALQQNNEKEFLAGLKQ